MADELAICFQSPRLRWNILGAYWLVILLALPLWWSITSIERLSLPTPKVRDLSNEKLRFPIHVRLDASTAGGNSAWLAREVQGLVNTQLKYTRYGLHGLDVHITSVETTDSSTSNVYFVKIDLEAQYFSIQGRNLTCTKDALSPSKLADTLTAVLAPYRNPDANTQRVARYSPRYRLAFSLLNEDAADGPAVVGWDIKEALFRHLYPTLDILGVLHNFTIESQVQFHAPLAFHPHALHTDEGNSHGITPEDLTVFVNSAEWTLSSSASNDPVLHFILFVPSSSRRPLRILDALNHPIPSSAFILPQWGGIILYNPPSNLPYHLHMSPSHLEPVISTFRRQLSALLGIPELPSGVVSIDSGSLSAWQLDALLRHRALENVQGSTETLQSIVKLVDQIKNMPVKEDVRDDIQDALTAFEMTYQAAPQSAALALLHSSQALTLSSRAFFNPGMLALLYFPPEHTYAVYAPLFAPISLPLIAPIVKELVGWLKAKKAARKGEKEKSSKEKVE